MVDDGMTVAEAARRLNLSEPTIRRHIGKELEEVPGSRPKRATRASVERLRATTLEQLGVHIASHPQTPAVSQTQLDELREENEMLRNVIRSVRLANQALDDALGQLTAPRIPNNWIEHSRSLDVDDGSERF